ncbi:MAG: vWA domain-containing protein [Treponemataceae bacterium]
MKRRFLLSTILIFLMHLIFSAELILASDDLFMEPAGDGGVNLYVRRKKDVSSILLCETTKDPEGVMANYAFRASVKNDINGNELRRLDTRLLTAEQARFSIVSSTVINHSVLGEAFHLYLPQTLEYGYPWTRNGTQKLENGLFINIRTFTLPYADYDGEFQDNPFMLNTIDITPKFVDNFNPNTVGAFKAIAALSSGDTQFSESPEDLSEKARNTMKKEDEKNLDIVFVIDATMSMRDDMVALRKDLIPSIKSSLEEFESYNIGLVVFKDYGDELKFQDLPVKLFDFTDDLENFQKHLNSFRVSGGGDIEEAVHEGLYAAAEFFPWREDASRRITLIGDAEPHSKPRGTGKYTAQIVKDKITEKGIKVNTIILFDPDRKE